MEKERKKIKVKVVYKLMAGLAVATAAMLGIFFQANDTIRSLSIVMEHIAAHDIHLMAEINQLQSNANRIRLFLLSISCIFS